MTIEHEQAEQRFYEPWQPTVGQRVRVRLSGECRRKLTDGVGKQIGRRFGHHESFDGIGGVVTSPLFASHSEPNSSQGHPYLVLFESDVTIDGHECVGDYFAAIELEPIDQ